MTEIVIEERYAGPPGSANGERLGAIGWPIRRDGRKLHTGSALFDENGDVVGVTKQTCILLR